MPKGYHLTPRASEAIRNIARWTTTKFGKAQARTYRAAILSQCRAITAGTAHTRLARDVFASDLPDDLMVTRAGQHFILFIEDSASVTITDIIHTSQDIPNRLRPRDDSR